MYIPTAAWRCGRLKWVPRFAAPWSVTFPEERRQLNRLLASEPTAISFTFTPQRRSRRRGGGVGQRVDDRLCGLLGGVDTVGDADAVEGDSGEKEAWVARELAADRIDAVEVAEGVLRHGARMAADLDELWGSRDADQVAELARDQLLDRIVAEVEELRTGRPADEDAHEHRARGGAAGELDAQERDGQDRSALDGRHHGAEAVERVLDLVAVVGDVDDD